MITTLTLLVNGLLAPPVLQEDPVADLWKQVVERLGVYGDIRLRYEGNYRLDDQPTRNRGRARLRLGSKIRVSEEFSAGFRVTTGNPDDPNSPHVDFGDALDSDPISFDRYFVTYEPDWAESLAVTAGKFSHGFVRNPVYSELVWDADVQPEGISATYGWDDVGGLDSVDLYVGEYVLIEQSLADEASIFVAQAAARRSVSEHADATLAVGWYRYTDTAPDGSTGLVGDDAGNVLVDTTVPPDGMPDEFLSDFSIVNPILSVAYDGWSEPVTFGAEWIYNLEAETSNDQGYAAGVSVGRGEAKGDWKAWYQFQHVEQEAVFSAFAQDDFLLGTNARTHAGGVKYKIGDKIELHLWAMASARDEISPAVPTADSDSSQWRLRLDLNITL